MSLSPKETVEKLFHLVGTMAPLEQIGALVAEDVDWFIAGDTAHVSWIGRKSGSAGAQDFYRQIREKITSEHFAIHEILSQGNRVLVIGELASRVISTGKLIETEFVFDLVVEQGKIARFRMFEDSFAVAQSVSNQE